MSAKNVIRLMKHLSHGLQAIHRIGFIHGDMKPENVVVFFKENNKFVFKLVDLGMAKPIGTTVHDKSGSPAYVAPELMTAEPVTIEASCDLFSLGVTLFVASTAKLLWETYGDDNCKHFWNCSNEIRFRGINESVVLCLKALICLEPKERTFPIIN